MLKKYVFLSTLVTIIMLFSGCINQNTTDNNINNQPPTSSELDLSNVVQLSAFSNNLDHKYSSISGNGQKIIYVQYPDNDVTYNIGESDFVHTAWSIWVTDTSGSKIQTEIFEGYIPNGLYGFSGDTGGTPVLNYDATYAYFGVIKYINYIGYYWLPALNPYYLARVRISDKSFEPIDLSQYSDYDFTWLTCFRVGSNKVYCLVTFSDKDGMGTEVKGRAFMEMNLDGSDQEFIYTTLEADAEASAPDLGYCFFLDENYNRLYYASGDSDYYYYLDLNTNTPVKINNEEIGQYWLRGVSGNKLIFYYSQDFYIHDILTNQVTKVDCEESGTVMYSVTSDKIYYYRGSGLFSYTDFEGNRVKLIGEESENASQYQGLYEWDIQYTPCNGKPVCNDSTRLLVKEDHNDNPNYYILKLET